VPRGAPHLLIDSTGLQVYGAGQWLEAKHGAKSRRKWRKLHLAVDADGEMIVAQTLTNQDADDPSQIAPLLDQIDGPITGVTADGAYDGTPTYQTIAAHGDGIKVVIPSRSTAVPAPNRLRPHIVIGIWRRSPSADDWPGRRRPAMANVR
jgi:hypothetical protein